MVREPKSKRGPGSILLALIAAVVVVDQATKWWGWRHDSAAIINSGGDPLTGALIGTWFRDPVQGALLDLLNCGLLGIASLVLLRGRRSIAVLVTGSLVIGGWSSNLLDRLFMHYWTAPGSVRGAVDFLQLGDRYFNVADVVIVSATPLFLLTVSAQYLRRFVPMSSARPGLVAPTPLYRQTLHRHGHRSGVRMAVLAGAASLTVAVGVGAANDSGASTPTAERLRGDGPMSAQLAEAPRAQARGEG
jgi:lipoprotein signal peptidase